MIAPDSFPENEPGQDKRIRKHPPSLVLEAFMYCMDELKEPLAEMKQRLRFPWMNEIQNPVDNRTAIKSVQYLAIAATPHMHRFNRETWKFYSGEQPFEGVDLEGTEFIYREHNNFVDSSSVISLRLGRPVQVHGIRRIRGSDRLFIEPGREMEGGELRYVLDELAEAEKSLPFEQMQHDD